MSDLRLSIVIVTYGRDQVLVDTLRPLLAQAEETAGYLETLVVDQTPVHESATDMQLRQWAEAGRIRWLRLEEPHLTRAMNQGLAAARGAIVLFTDDDIIPAPDLARRHLAAYAEHPATWAVVGQILQPGEVPEDLPYSPRGGHLRRFLDFPFRRTRGAFVENAMAGNFSMVREKALALGGFDENFTPPVASRFESEFAKRLVAAGGTIWYEPRASIRHLQAAHGGTRSQGSHLNSLSPRYGVGDYYFALRQGAGWEKWWYILKKPFREVRTKYHLRHPWWIPLKLIGELRAMVAALRLYRQGPRLLSAPVAPPDDPLRGAPDDPPGVPPDGTAPR